MIVVVSLPLRHYTEPNEIKISLRSHNTPQKIVPHWEGCLLPALCLAASIVKPSLTTLWTSDRSSIGRSLAGAHQRPQTASISLLGFNVRTLLKLSPFKKNEDFCRGTRLCHPSRASSDGVAPELSREFLLKGTTGFARCGPYRPLERE